MAVPGKTFFFFFFFFSVARIESGGCRRPMGSVKVAPSLLTSGATLATKKGLPMINFKKTNRDLKRFFSDDFWSRVQHEANNRLRLAVKDQRLQWSRLPDLLGNNPKVEKGEKAGYATAIMHLAPSFASGFNLCPFASRGCGMTCLNTAGHGQRHMVRSGVHSVHVARVIRSLVFQFYRQQFIDRLQYEIGRHYMKARRNGYIPAVRLNGTSDIRWERVAPSLFADNPETVFYDYTKIPGRKVERIPNYSLTFSLSEENHQQAAAELLRGVPVAAVFRLKPGNKRREGEPLPQRVNFGGRLVPVIDGDITDVRFTDPPGVIVGLRAKGSAYDDRSGFVLEPVEG